MRESITKIVTGVLIIAIMTICVWGVIYLNTPGAVDPSVSSSAQTRYRYKWEEKQMAIKEEQATAAISSARSFIRFVEAYEDNPDANIVRLQLEALKTADALRAFGAPMEPVPHTGLE